MPNRLIAAFAALLTFMGVARAADIAAFATSDAASAIAVDNTAYGRLLAAYARPKAGEVTRVAYGAVTPADKQALKAAIAAYETVRPTTLSRDEAFAYWVNLYNAATVSIILDRYPVKSIREIKPTPISLGPWDKKVVTVDGQSLSLNDIEHKILRPFFKDNRVHFAVNCASIGCPDLRAEPWTAAGLSAALDTAARAYVNSPRGVTVTDGKVTVSSIFKWYRKDFGATDRQVLDYLAKYAEPGLKASLDAAPKISGDAYDWALNDAR